MKKQLPVGKSDFRELRKDGFFYVDKSLFIREILDTSFEV
ncbi:MAG: AAA family ATPase, partial [Proteobacteria bacterium]|nr:AAA family ATPase [Pseudomonadota bacterium]